MGRAPRSGRVSKNAGGSRHGEPLLPAAASLMARQTRSGVQGISRWRTPRWLRASTTAFWTAGIEPIVPDSPMPFAPSGLSGVGVSVFSVSNEGSSAALGMAYSASVEVIGFPSSS